jgi:hypothetical protein
VTNSTVQFTEGGAKLLIRRDHQVDIASLPIFYELLSLPCDLGQPAAEGSDHRVFLSRGLSGREGWHAFARILVRWLEELGCPTWNVVVKARTASEDDDLMETNEYGVLGKDLVYIDVDAERHLATYSVSAQAVDDMDLLCDKDCRTEAAADAIVEHLMAADGMFDNDEDKDYDEDDKP